MFFFMVVVNVCGTTITQEPLLPVFFPKTVLASRFSENITDDSSSSSSYSSNIAGECSLNWDFTWSNSNLYQFSLMWRESGPVYYSYIKWNPEDFYHTYTLLKDGQLSDFPLLVEQGMTDAKHMSLFTVQINNTGYPVVEFIKGKKWAIFSDTSKYIGSGTIAQPFPDQLKCCTITKIRNGENIFDWYCVNGDTYIKDSRNEDAELIAHSDGKIQDWLVIKNESWSSIDNLGCWPARNGDIVLQASKGGTTVTWLEKSNKLIKKDHFSKEAVCSAAQSQQLIPNVRKSLVNFADSLL